MTKQEEDKVCEIIHELSKAGEMLNNVIKNDRIDIAKNERVVKEAKGIITNASFDLDNMI